MSLDGSWYGREGKTSSSTLANDGSRSPRFGTPYGEFGTGSANLRYRGNGTASVTKGQTGATMGMRSGMKMPPTTSITDKIANFPSRTSVTEEKNERQPQIVDARSNPTYGTSSAARGGHQNSSFHQLYSTKKSPNSRFFDRSDELDKSSAHYKEEDLNREGEWKPQGSVYCVTVFGFEPENADIVIERFKRLGVIEEFYRTTGNWVNISFKNQSSVEKALAMNGTFIGHDLMIAVKRCSAENFRPQYDRQRSDELDEQLVFLRGPKYDQYLASVETTSGKANTLVEKLMSYVFNFD
eukprot:CAMPEP_0114972538 /NCGR_PEP_ID=MMETSP0216-20121206/451_1 /TAXON_ID=223996 /ORGANISM="Protocruzia adherens, Strain Boccale" /LENGTH=296 /DNA_ID=CAMNT_0002332923 /DNA_START=49 /DNA_END=939 /DNA_ORIENTATION=-